MHKDAELQDILATIIEAAKSPGTSRAEKVDKARRIGSLIHAFRELLNLSPTEFARACGVAVQTVYRWEKGEKEPRLHYIRNLDSLIAQRGMSLTTEIMSNSIRSEEAFYVNHDVVGGAEIIPGRSEIGPPPEEILSTLRFNLRRAGTREHTVSYYVPKEPTDMHLRVWKFWHDAAWEMCKPGGEVWKNGDQAFFDKVDDLREGLISQLKEARGNPLNQEDEESFKKVDDLLQEIIQVLDEIRERNNEVKLSPEEKRTIRAAGLFLEKLDIDARLNVFQIAGTACVHPTIVLRFPGELAPSKGWVWYAPWNGNAGVEMPKEVLKFWFEQFRRTSAATPVRWVKALGEMKLRIEGEKNSDKLFAATKTSS